MGNFLTKNCCIGERNSIPTPFDDNSRIGSPYIDRSYKNLNTKLNLQHIKSIKNINLGISSEFKRTLSRPMSLSIKYEEKQIIDQNTSLAIRKGFRRSLTNRYNSKNNFLKKAKLKLKNKLSQTQNFNSKDNYFKNNIFYSTKNCENYLTKPKGDSEYEIL
jgi:hypothetical protein